MVAETGKISLWMSSGFWGMIRVTCFLVLCSKANLLQIRLQFLPLFLTVTPPLLYCRCAHLPNSTTDKTLPLYSYYSLMPLMSLERWCQLYFRYFYSNILLASTYYNLKGLQTAIKCYNSMPHVVRNPVRGETSDCVPCKSWLLLHILQKHPTTGEAAASFSVESQSCGRPNYSLTLLHSVKPNHFIQYSFHAHFMDGFLFYFCISFTSSLLKVQQLRWERTWF